MSDAAEETEDALDEAPKKGKKKLLIVAVLLLVAIGAGVFFSGILGGKEEPVKQEVDLPKEKEGKAAPAKTAYYELPQFLVNLSNNTGRVSFLKMSVTLELRDAEAAKVVDENKPKIMDAFNTYLRELRPTDLAGSAGIYRLREELMTRLNNTIEPDLVKDILFSEILVQ